MKRLLIASVSAALLLVLRAPADEIEWRSAPGGQPAPASAPAVLPEPITVKPVERPASPAQPPFIRFEDSESMVRQQPSPPVPMNPAPSSPPLPSYQALSSPRMLPNPTSVPGMPQWKAFTGADNTPTYELVGDDPQTNGMAAGEPHRQWYASAEVLLWWISPMNAPPLLTTATPPNMGFIGGPTTQILIGNGPVNDPFELGGRFSAGLWLDCCHEWAVDASFFFLGPKRTILSANSQDFPVLIRPFFAANPQINAEFGEIVAFPPGFAVGGIPIPSSSGSFTVTATSLLLGAEANVRRHYCITRCDGSSVYVDPFVGVRFLDL
ncbi:MAG TPA: BBP7 family outer membrane beta-barrel protein, partial [Gemmataceae bacterium]|nr:BBP7 family outer membrane beta-barrel protein [Gemmataceae bacterium]